MSSIGLMSQSKSGSMESPDEEAEILETDSTRRVISREASLGLGVIVVIVAVDWCNEGVPTDEPWFSSPPRVTGLAIEVDLKGAGDDVPHRGVVDEFELDLDLWSSLAFGQVVASLLERARRMRLPLSGNSEVAPSLRTA